MPDWSYQTLLRPVLFRLPAAVARNLALKTIGTLGRAAWGRAIIDFLGHMRPDERLACQVAGVDVETPVGLSGALDPFGDGLPGLARFGVGFVEIGPITEKACGNPDAVELLAPTSDILFREPLSNCGIAAWIERLERLSPLDVPILARLAIAPEMALDDARESLHRMAVAMLPHVRWLSFCSGEQAMNVAGARELVARLVAAAGSHSSPRPVFVCVSAFHSAAQSEIWIQAALESGAAGILVEGTQPQSGAAVLRGASTFAETLGKVAEIRRLHGPHFAIIANGGIHEPEQALQFLAAGADLVQLDTGLVFGGPELPKRINAAILVQRGRHAANNCASPSPAARSSRRPWPVMRYDWFWALLLGMAMFGGGLLALAIACTRTILPYDEQFVGLSRGELMAANRQLLPFMAHDRVTLAGAMISDGVLLAGLAWFGMRRGQHWARAAVLISTFAGFFTFFLFLGFGYLEPFHALVTALLFPILLLCCHARSPRPALPEQASLYNDAAWRRGLWGQLLFLCEGGACIAAGLVIATIGATSVFVREDLEFLCTSAGELAVANPRLVPLVAHDRATLGGMLIANGLLVLLTALWGFRHGSRWLWSVLLIAGVVGYAAAIGVHYSVGYTSPVHLLPAFAGLGVLLLASALSYRYMFRAPESCQMKQPQLTVE